MMNFISREPAGHPAQIPADNQSRSVSSAETSAETTTAVTISGWIVGAPPIDGYHLAQVIQKTGVRLGEALSLTKHILNGEDVTIQATASTLDEFNRVGARALARPKSRL